MTTIRRIAAVAALTLASGAALSFACGTPSQPPPPPPAPPIVCCVPVKIICLPPSIPGGPPRYIVLFRYFLRDGGPLFQSNPMLLLPTQRCLCALPRPAVLPPGSFLVRRMTFGNPSENYCDMIPGNIPGYGPFTPLANSDPAVAQIDSFFDIWYGAAGLNPSNPQDLIVGGFRGPGTIPPNSFFDVFVELELAPGLDPGILRQGGAADGAVSLFLEDNNQVMVEPVSPGLPPIPLAAFSMNPGQSAFWRIRPYRWTGPLCIVGAAVTPCPADLNGDGLVNAADLATMLGSWGPCPAL